MVESLFRASDPFELHNDFTINNSNEESVFNIYPESLSDLLRNGDLELPSDDNFDQGSHPAVLR